MQGELNMAQRPGATRTRTTGVRNTHTSTNGKTISTRSARSTARPTLRQRGTELQQFGTITALPNGLDQKSLTRIVADLNQLLADTMTLRDLYKKHHWQVVGPTFYQLHLLFDKHYEEQATLVDQIAERIQLLGGLSIAMAAYVA
jgi:starvation-inducible DNA-binding protein